MRINKFLASCGLGSRRGCEEIIRTGQVIVNGEPCIDLATQIEPGDSVEYGGRTLQAAPHLYVAFHKPKGAICTKSDEKQRKTIYGILPNAFRHLHYVGRLDKDSEGLMLLTNDGDFSNALTHPANKVEKEYVVTTDHVIDKRDIKPLLEGIRTPDGLAVVARVEHVAPRVLAIVLTQGLKRQIRVMLASLGYDVVRLVRIRIGGYGIDDIAPGKWRRLTGSDLSKFKG